MNPIAEEILRCIEALDSGEDLAHYGTPRHSGRYPWGSGDDPYQRTGDFIARVEKLRDKGFTYTDPKTGKSYKGDTAIAKALGMSTGEFRTEWRIATHERKLDKIKSAKSMKGDGLTTAEIARRLGESDSTVRGWLDGKGASDKKLEKVKGTADFLKEQCQAKKMVDVGKGVERELGVSSEHMKEALNMLKREGYNVYGGGIPQPTNPGQQTNQQVLCAPGVAHRDIFEPGAVQSLMDYVSRDGGKSYMSFKPPVSMDSKRLMVRYADDVGPDGFKGIEKDGIIELRRGVEDLSMGGLHYAQVRIMVDGDRYLKGMAVYSDDMPPGVDVIFNTNKKSSVPVRDVLKKVSDDPENPFGAIIKANGQREYLGKDGKMHQSPINRVRDEADWSDWADTLPAQFLSKQSKELARRQLALAKEDKQAEFDEIMTCTNPTVKKYLLNKFADECDSAAVDLKAAALPGQKYHVIVPINTVKDNEIYAPRYDDGTEVALVRYPHAGIFEIPILKVNNKNPLAKKWLGEASGDGVGINKRVADQLSGADFDGDTVMVLPITGKTRIKNRPYLEGLVGFDPKEAYPEREGMRYMKNPVTEKDSTGLEMGKITNLISDMTLLGASDDEMTRAVKHSMVVIDAAKHKLDYVKSEKDNDIASLKKLYQIHPQPDGSIEYGGASTIVSKSTSPERVPKRQGSRHTNVKGTPWYDPSRPEGALIWKVADDAFYTKEKTNKRTGEVTLVQKTKTIETKKMSNVDDAYELVSPARHPMEMIYADHANSMKAMANKARLEAYGIKEKEQSAAAKVTYAAEKASLEAKLNTALLNSPREREALRRANAEIAQKVKAKEETGTEYTKKELKKIRARATEKGRISVSSVARRYRNIDITDREWEAIQAGAISKTTLTKIMANTDIDAIRQRAMPKTTTTLSTAKVNKMNQMLASGNYTLAQIAEACGVSTSTISKYRKGGN